MYTLSYMQNNANTPMNPPQNTGGNRKTQNSMNVRNPASTPSAPTYDNGQSKTVPSIPTYDANQSNVVPSIPTYDTNQPNVVPSIPTYDTDQPNVVPSIPTYDTDQPNVVPSIPTYDTDQPNVVPSIPTYDTDQPNVVPSIPTYDTDQPNVVPSIPTYDTDQPNVVPSIPTYDTGSGNPASGIWGSIITVFPRPIIPCYFCNTTQYGVVRFLNAAAGYNPFIIYINDQMVVNSLDNAEVSQYGRVSSGAQTVTVSGQNGYVYIQKQITVPLNSAVTVAIINTNNGLDLLTIPDVSCNGGTNTGCFRACNLSNTNRSVNVTLNGGAVTFQNVNYSEVTNFRYLPAGYYTVSVSNGSTFAGNALLTSNIYIRGNVSYTLYVFNWNNSQDAIRILIVEDRKN